MLFVKVYFLQAIFDKYQHSANVFTKLNPKPKSQTEEGVDIVHKVPLSPNVQVFTGEGGGIDAGLPLQSV